MNKRFVIVAVVLLSIQSPTVVAQSLDTFADVNRYAQERSVKIYGAGGLAQLEAYQSGCLVSADGHVATVASVVLDQDFAMVHLAGGLRVRGEVVGVDPLMDIALLKLATDDGEYPYFDLSAPPPDAIEGTRILAFSNLYNVATGGEPVSVLHGVVTAIAPLEARRGAFATRYRGEVYIVDAATNNPGAAGGVVVDYGGRPLGMIGKEVRSELTGAWLNYVLPWNRVAESANRILSGELGTLPDGTADLPENPLTFASLGLRLVPSVVPRTPPYVDVIAFDSPAADAGIEPDDLLIAVGGMRTGTHADVQQALRRLPDDQPVAVTLLRGNRLIELEIAPNAEVSP